MVLAELGASITSALSKATKSNVDSALLDEILKDIATALLSADVNVRLVATLRANVKKRVNLEEIGTGLKVERVINEAVFKELVAILDPGVPKKEPDAREAERGSLRRSAGCRKGGCADGSQSTAYSLFAVLVC